MHMLSESSIYYEKIMPALLKWRFPSPAIDIFIQHYSVNLVENPNKGHLQLSGQHDMHRLNFSIQINLPTKDTSI